MLYLQRTGLLPLVTDIHSRDPVDPKLMKPDPHLLNSALASLRATPSEAAFVGDTLTDALAATSVGMPFVGYANKPGKWDVLTAAGASYVTSEIANLTRML
jgi:phosphoglycolate phosphatase-like HAD superfamily hydrolase